MAKNSVLPWEKESSNKSSSQLPWDREKQEGERYVNNMRVAPDISNPFQAQQNQRETFSPAPAQQSVTGPLQLPSPSQFLKDQVENNAIKQYVDNKGPSRLEWARQKVASDSEKSSNNPVFKAIDQALKPVSSLIALGQSYIPGVSSFQQGAGEGANVKAETAPTGGGWIYDAVDVPARILGNIAGSAAVMQGAGIRPVADPLSFGKGVAYAASKATPILGGKVAQNTIEGISGSVIAGMADSALRGQTDLKDLAISGGIAGATGGLLDGGGTLLGQAFRNTGNAAQDIIGNRMNAAGAIESAARSTPTGPLRVQNNTERLSNLMEQIRPTVTERMTPPLENQRELAKWLQPHLGNTSLNEINRLPYNDMVDLANEVRRSMTVPDMARQVARESGQDLDGLLNQTAPTFRQTADRMRMGGVSGAIEPPQNVRVALNDGTGLKSTPKPKQQVSINTVSDAQPSTNVRGFNRTIRQSKNVTPEVRQGLEVSPNRTYEPITNAQTVETANRRIVTLGVDKAEAELLNKAKFTANDVATGMRLVQELQTSGNVQRAVTVADRLATELTKAGQTVQAASIWNRLSPEGALLAAQRKVNQVNDNLLRGQTPVKLSDAQATTITDAAQTLQAAGVSQQRAGDVSEIMNRVRAGETITPDEQKIVSDFVQDAKKFLQPTKQRTQAPKLASVPKEMKDARVRDRVVSYMEEQEQAALQRIRARRNQLSSTPFDEWADYAIVGASKLAKGVRNFADWSEQMVRDFGENIRPYLNDIYDRAKDTQTQNVKKINEQVISRAERIATSYVKRNEANLSPSDIDFVQNLARKVSELSGQEQRIASQDLQAVLQSFEKVGIGRKLQSAQYISMLLNPLTQIRNIAGNELLYRLERLQRVVSTPIDIAASKITGGPRTITFKRGPNVWENFFQPTQDFIGNLGEGLRAGWKGVSPEGLQSKYEINGQAFRSKFNPMTYLEKSLGAVLQGFDYAAYQRATNQRLSEMAYLDALNRGIKGDDAIRQHMQTVMTNIDDATLSIARDYGKFVTLQNDSVLAQKLMGFRGGLNKITTGTRDFGVGSTVLPFAKTPANLLLRALDYSPAGVLKALKQTYDVIRNPNTDLTRADVIESISRAAFGSGIGVLAYWLTDKGALMGKSDKDSEVRKLMQASGVKDFQINGSAMVRMLNALFTGEDVDKSAKLQPGDTLWGYEWAQPISMPVAVGSTIYQGIKSGDKGSQMAIDGALAGANTLLDSSVLSGIREVFQTQSNDDNPLKSVFMNIVRQIPGQFVPSLMRQYNTLTDNTQRETMSMKGDTFGQVTNSAQANIPGLAQQLPQRVNTLGEPQTKLNTFLDVFVSPAQRSVYKPTPEAQLVIDLINETGDNSIAPRAVAKYISGKDRTTGETRRVDLTPEQFVELQTIVGQETAEGLKKINPNWSTEKKVTEIIKILDAAGKKGRDKFKKEFGLRVTR